MPMMGDLSGVIMGVVTSAECTKTAAFYCVGIYDEDAFYVHAPFCR